MISKYRAMRLESGAVDLICLHVDEKVGAEHAASQVREP